MEFDHIVVAAEHLDEAVEYIETSLGIEMYQGGQHLRYGTHNAVAAIGQGCYIEAIARDYDVPNPQGARWFDLDRFQGAPRVITWACRVMDIQTVLPRVPASAGPAVDMQRGGFEWKINVARSGRMLHDGAFPQLLEWRAGGHPCDRLPDPQAILSRLVIMHPNASSVTMTLPELTKDHRIEIISGPEVAFRADFDTPLGPKALLG